MMGRKCFSLHYRALRQSLERLDKKFCNDPHWMAAAVEATGIPAVEVRACCRSRSLPLAPPPRALEACRHAHSIGRPVPYPTSLTLCLRHPTGSQISTRLQRMAEGLEALPADQLGKNNVKKFNGVTFSIRLPSWRT